jgi:hypothetical protein
VYLPSVPQHPGLNIAGTGYGIDESGVGTPANRVTYHGEL